MRCPDCGATNPDRATWCGQCYTALGEARAPADDGAAAETTAEAVEHGGLPAAPQPGPGAPPPREDAARLAERGLRRVDGELEWACVTCDTFNPMELMTCRTCGTPFTARFAEPEPEVERNWQAALLASLPLPGLGHWTVDRKGSGLARMLLFLVWLIGGVLLLGGGGGVIAAMPLLLGAVAVWAGSLVDILRLQRDEAELLTGRTLLWLVVGVTVLLLLGVLVQTMAVR